MVAWFAVACGSDGDGDNEPPDDSTIDTDTTSTADTVAPGPPDACTELGLTVRAWQEGGATAPPYLNAVATDFTLKLRGSEWTLSESFTGCDNYLFVRAEPRNADGPWMWESEDHKDLLKALPFNTHLFFVPDDGTRDGDRAQLDVIEAKMDDAISRLGQDKQAWWGSTDRIHYVKDSVTEIDGWVGDYLRTPGWGFSIDRLQRIRDIGSLADGERYNGSWFDSNLSHVAHEAIYNNAISDDHDALDAQTDVRVIETWTGQVVADPSWSGARGSITVEFPDSATMATYDGLTIDMNMTCEGEGEYGTCPAWDRITDMYVCDVATEDSNPHASEACTAAVDTVPCGCADVMGTPYDAARTCAEDGSGYGECACSCNTLLNRWITTYHREGRWINDADHALAWFRRGGEFRFEYHSIDPWEIDIDLRFHDRGLPEQVEQTFPLFRGGNFDATYNDSYVPKTIEIPADAKRVELAVIVSGHGQAAPDNCAEFCNSQHHFLVNGVESMIDFPYLDDPSLTGEFCQNDVANGTVPNQYGTWFYARSNWCPGKEVAPILVDVTASVTPGSPATFEYWGDRSGGGTHPGGASIVMDSFVVIHR